ncbi:hypothetical protein [Glycomyces sp. MUSA5-2]|uniref:hypothetical protein n=1 Tax=Glycomyces sp. MUSA5-2 TaxID=2053002 RepID=UPI003008BE18
MRALVALAGLDIGNLRAGPPRSRAAPVAIAAGERASGIVFDERHRWFLRYADGWPALWPVALFGLAELGDRSRMAAMTAQLAATGDLASQQLETEDVYPVAWAREGGTAVVVRPGHERAGHVFWFEGVQTGISPGFDAFIDGAVGRLLEVAGPLAGGQPAIPIRA